MSTLTSLQGKMLQVLKRAPLSERLGALYFLGSAVSESYEILE